MKPSEHVASRFHEAYGRLAGTFGWPVRPESRVAWADLPPPNRRLMIATIEELAALGVISVGHDR